MRHSEHVKVEIFKFLFAINEYYLFSDIKKKLCLVYSKCNGSTVLCDLNLVIICSQLTIIDVKL